MTAAHHAIARSMHRLSGIGRLSVRPVVAAGLLLLTLTAVQIAAPAPAHAANGADFKPGNIIDDGTFTNKNSMSVDQIQSFLNQKVPACDTNGDKMIYDGSHGDTVTRRVFSERRGKSAPFTCLRDYREHDKSAAQIIWEQGQNNSINPQVLIVLLQKEQALVTDDWPWPQQYRTATGYGCPDTAPCDAEYFGFTNQVQKAARMFRLIMNDEGLNLYPPGVNSILWSPNHACGSSQVTVQNRATSALYTYTPYQPNAAALSNMYGTGDGCSAYGNRNFWRDFTDWFGPTSAEGFTLAKSTDSGDNRRWVIYYNIKQLIPNTEVLNAWGLQDVTPVAFSPSTLTSIPSGPDLGRRMKVRGSATQYLLDNGKKYNIASPDMLEAWTLQNTNLSTVSTSLANVPDAGGPLSYSVRKDGAPGVYMVSGSNGSDQVMLRSYPNPQILLAWEGDAPRVTVVSPELFNRIDNAVGAPLASTKITYGGKYYMVNKAKRLTLNDATKDLYPGAVQSVPQDTIERLAYNGVASPFVRVDGTNGVYLVDEGQKHTITDPYVLRAWGANNQPLVNVVNQAYADFIPTDGQQVSSYIARASSGQRYLLDGRKLPIPAHLHQAYGSSGMFTASDDLLSTLQTGPDASLFIKTTGKPGIALMENGVRRPFSAWADFSLWSNGGHYFVEVKAAVANSFARSERMDAYVTLSGINYLIDGGTRHVVSGVTAAGMGLGAPVNVSENTLYRMATGSAFSEPEAKNGSDYYRFENSVAWVSGVPSIAQLWHLTDAPSMSSTLLSKVAGRGSLSRFIKSTDPADARLFTIDNNKIYQVSSYPMLWNLGYKNTPFMAVVPSQISSRLQGTTWQRPVVKSGAGDYYILDEGTQRAFSSNESRNQWTANGTLGNIVTASDTLLAMIGNGSTVGKSVKGPSSNIYAGIDGQKRWIQSSSTYDQHYAPYTQVSEALINALPAGNAIP